MAINGSLDEASLADVLQLLSLGCKTGRLSVSDQSNLGHIYLESGRIIHAYLENRRHRLGDILFKSGRITQDQLNDAIRVQRENPKKKVGEILVETGAMSADELNHYMQVQIEEAVYFLFTWRSGDFAFERDVEPDPEDFLVSINPEALLLEGARRVDEWSVIEKKIPSFDMVFSIDEERVNSSDATLSDEQKRIASLLDGERDVAAIVAETGMIEFDVGKALYGLVTAGFAEAVGPSGEEGERDSDGDDSSGHLNYDKLLAYLARQAEFADEEQRRQSEIHIADCPTCSKRLQEIHIRRSQGLQPIPEEAVDKDEGQPAEFHASKRRSIPDRRRSDSSSAIDAASDRRVHGAGDRRSSARAAAVDERTFVERRSGLERRQMQRRVFTRRSSTPVDRSDRFAVERRSGLERRLRDRRVVPRRRADAQLLLKGGLRKTAALELGGGASEMAGRSTTGQRQDKPAGSRSESYTHRQTGSESVSSPESSSPTSSHRETVARERPKGDEVSDSGPPSSKDQSGLPVEKPASSTPSAPGPTGRRTRASVRRTRESPLKGIPLLADGTEWMFIERVDDDRASDEGGGTPAEESVVTQEPTERREESKSPERSEAVTGAEAPTPATESTDSEEDNRTRRSSRWGFRSKKKDKEADKARREIEQERREREKAERELEKERRELEKAREELEKAKSEAERAKQESERAKAESEKARADADEAASKAERAEANAERAEKKADSVKSVAEKRRSQATQTAAENQQAKQQIAEAKADAEKAREEADRAKADAEQARKEAEKVKVDADRAREEAESARAESERSRQELERAKSETEALSNIPDLAEVEEEDETTDVPHPRIGRGTPVTLSRPEPRVGRGTPISLTQLVGDSPVAPPVASPDDKPTRTQPSDEQRHHDPKNNRKYVAYMAAAATVVLAVAAGWLLRPLLTGADAAAIRSADVTRELPGGEARQSLQGPAAVTPDTATGIEAAVEQDVRMERPARTNDPTPTIPEPTPEAEAPAPAREPPATEERIVEREPEVQQPAAAAATEPEDTITEVAAAATTADISGTVTQSGTGARIAGAAVTIPAEDLETFTDATGSFEFAGVAAGSLSVTVTLDGYMPGEEAFVVNAGESIALEIELSLPPTPVDSDVELDGGQWVAAELAEAEIVLGRPVVIIEGLWIESIAIPATGSRPRVRVAQLDESGERITMVMSRSGPANVTALARVRALHIVPPTEAYPITTGTANFGGLMVTAKASIPPATLRALLQRLMEVTGN